MNNFELQISNLKKKVAALETENKGYRLQLGIDKPAPPAAPAPTDAEKKANDLKNLLTPNPDALKSRVATTDAEAVDILKKQGAASESTDNTKK